MFGFPKGTEFGKRIPKQKFYENLNVSATLKRVFVEQIRSIYWRNKIAPSTINIASGLNVSEVPVFEITLSQKGLDEAVLAQIDKEIPYHILFILSLGEGNEESLKESVEKDEKRKDLEKQIAALGKKIKKEKQLNRQMELNGELKKLRKELGKI